MKTAKQKKVTISAYVPAEIADAVHREAQRKESTASRWIETAIRRRLILDGAWDKRGPTVSEDDPEKGGRKTGSALINNVTEEKAAGPQSSDCKANGSDAE